MAEGFIIPITYQAVNEQVLDEGLRKVDALVKAAGEAVQAAQKAGTAASRSTLKPNTAQDARVAAAAATRTDGNGAKTNQYDFIHASEMKRLAELQAFGKEGLASLLRVKEQVINLMAPYQELEKIITQAAAAQAKFDAYQKESTLNQVKATKTMQAFTELTDRLHAAEARRVEGNMALTRAVMQSEAANKKELTALQTRLDLEQKLATAQERGRQSGLVEAVMKEESALRVATATLKAYLDIQEKLAIVRGKTANVGEVKTLIEEEGAFKRLVVATTELEKVKLKLAEAQTRMTPEYLKELHALQQLTREEMVKAETSKLIDKLYKDRAAVLAYSSTEYKNEAASLQKLTQEERVAAETAKAMEKAQERLARAIAATNPDVQKLVEQYKKLEKQQREATTAGGHWSKHIAGLNQLTASFRAALSGVGMGFGIYTSATIVAASATYGLVNAVKQIVAVGAEFTKELSVVNAAMGLTAEQYQTLEKASIEMSASSRYSATQVVQAFREMGMSGFEYQEAMEGVSSVLTLASIGMMSFGQASDIATNVLYGFGLEAADLSRVVDVMAQAVTDSAQTVEQLGTTMSYVAPVAQSFGVSLETVTAATQVLVNAGIKSSRAGTGLRRVFTALFSDSENVIKQLGELGVTVNTMAGDMDAELVRVLKAVYAATNGATTGIGNLTKAIGLYGIPSFLALVKSVGDGSESLEDITAKLRGAGGAAYEMKKRIEENLAIDFEKLQAAISAVQEKIFMLFGESLREATQAITAFIRGFAEDNGAIKKFIAEMEDVLLVLGIIAGGAVLAAAAKAILNVVMAIQKVTIATNAASKAFVLFNSVAQRSLLGSIVKILGGITALWQGYEVYNALSETIPQVTEETLALSRAQDVLNEAMMGIKVSPEVEGFAVKAKEIKQSEIELQIQLEKVQKEWEATSDAAVKAQDAGKDTMDVYIRRMEELEKQEKALAKSLGATTKAFKAALKDLMEAEVGVLKSKGMKIEVDLTIKTSELEALKKKLEEGKRIIKEARETQFQWNPFGDAEGLTKYIAELNPELALVYARVQELTRQIEELKKEQDRYNATGKATIEALEKEAAALTDATAAAQLYAEVGERSRNNIDEALRKSASVAREVAEANRIEGMSVGEKIGHYTRIIEVHREHEQTLRDVREAIAKTEMEYRRLTDLQATAPLDESQKAELQRLQALREGYGAFQVEFVSGMDVYRNAMEELGKLTQKRIEEMVELKLKLVDLLNTPFEGDFVDTLKGQVDFLLKETDAMVAKFSATTEAFVEMENAVSSAVTGMSRSAGVTYPRMEGMPSMQGYEKLKISQDEYIQVVRESIGLNSAQEASLRSLLPYLDQLAEKHNLNREALVSLIAHESAFNKLAVSSVGAMGLMQVMPETARKVAEKYMGAFDQAKYASMEMRYNMELGTQLMVELLGRYKNNWQQMLADWNGGPRQAMKLEQGKGLGSLHPETAGLVDDVTQKYLRLDAAMKNATATTSELNDETRLENERQSAVAAGLADNTSGLNNTAEATASLADQTNELQQASAGLTEEQRGSANVALQQVAALMKARQAYAQLKVTLKDFKALQEQEVVARSKALEAEKKLQDLLARTNNGRTATDMQIEEMEKLRDFQKQFTDQANKLYEKQGDVTEELVKQGVVMKGLYDYSEPRLQALSDGYDSVNTRSRAYRLTMFQIMQLEEKGYLTKTEAMLARIDASLASLHPLARDFAENISNAFKVLLLEGGNSKEVFTDLKKTLVDMTMERYVIKITTNLIGSVMDPILRSFESVAMNLLYGFGSMLANSVAGLFGGNSTGAGMGIGGVGGLSNLFSLKGLNDLFGGSSIGTSVANSIAKLGLGTQIGESAGYEITSALKPWLSGIANMPNWVLGAGGLLGGLASNAIFKGQGYSGIGSSIGGLAGGLGGSALAGTLGLAAGPAGWAIAGIGAILGSIAGGGIGSLFGDKEPRYGTLAAQTGNRVVGLEDWENGPANYSKGAFGLTFGITDKGSKNMNASELKEVYDALAQISNKLADFFGEDLSKFITDELQKMSTFGDGLLHFTENEGDLGGAMAGMIKAIAEAAGRSSEDIGIAFQAMVGDIGGTAEEVAAQIESAMAASLLVVELSDRYDERIGEMLNLTGNIKDDVKLLSGYIDQFGQSGELSAATLTRLVAQLGVLDSAAQQTATSLEGMTTEAMIKLSDEVVEAMGGLEKATAEMTFFYQEFTSESEKLADAVKAAAKTINREIPKLQDELIKLSKDVITEIVKTLPQEAEKTRKAVDELLRDVAGGKAVYAPLIEGARRWIEDIANLEKSIEAFYSLPDNGRGRPPKDLLINDLLGKVDEGLVDFGDTLRRLGFDVDNGAEAFLESLKRIRDGVQGPISSGGGGGAVIDTITTPGDPNAAILAKLLDDLPKTRQGFDDLIGSIKLTTEAGRKLHAGLLELAPQFDLLYDGVEAFTDWLLGVDEVSAATRELERVFSDWGLTLPENRDALRDLYDSGVLSAEQMAILAAYLKELGLVFGDIVQPVTNPDNPEEPVKPIDTKLADEARRAYDDLVRSADAERDRINAAYQSRVDALNAEREAITEVGNARLAALASEREAAQSSLAAAQSSLSTIQSAIASLRGSIGVDEFSRVKAQRQLAAWAAGGMLPSQEDLSLVLPAATAINPADFATEQAYRLSQGSTLANLLALEETGVKQVSIEERTLAAIDAQTEAAKKATEDQLAAIERQIESAGVWRDDQLNRINALLENAKAQLDAALGNEQATLSLADAIRLFNDSLKELNPESTPIALEALGASMQSSVAELSATISQTLSAQSNQQAAEIASLRAEITALRADNVAISTQQTAPMKSIDDRLRRWEIDGLPASSEIQPDITVLRAA